MTYDRHWTLKLLIQGSIIFIAALTYSALLTHGVNAIEGAQSIERREMGMILLMIPSTILCLLPAIAFIYFEKMVAAALMVIVIVWIATPVITNFYLDASPLS